MPPPCSRCKHPSATVHLPEGPRCSPCFQNYLQRAFKTALGRASAGGPPHSVAVGLSGGPSSTAAALLLSRYAATLSTPPDSAPARPLLLHVTAAATVTASATIPPAVHAVAHAIPHAILRLVRLPLPLCDALAQVPDPTDRAHFARVAVFNALSDAACAARRPTLMLGTSATRAAADVLSALSTARGADVRCVGASYVEVAAEGGRIRVVRPLVGVQARLALRFARMVMPGVPYDARGSAGVLGVYGKGGGLYDVVERFVEEVGSNSSSVHNVVKTAARLKEGEGESVCTHCRGLVGGGEEEEEEEEGELCSFCEDARGRGGHPVLQLMGAEKERRRKVSVEEMEESIREFVL